jgi:hypothetical protein
MLDKLERWFGRFALPNVTLYLIIGQVFVLLSAMLGQLDLAKFVLVPGAVLNGEWWRLITFVFFPPPTSFIWVAFAWYAFYLTGSAMEGYWGSFRYNLYLIVGYGLTVGASFLLPFAPVTNLFIANSVFLAFAWLNPDFEFVIFFILPVKVKWLALLSWVGVFFVIATGSWPIKAQALASVANLFLFFGRDLVMTMRYRRRQMERGAQRFSESSREPEPRHRCFVCGKTDLTNPEMDFRYCSKCAGDQCYCPEHIFNHEHVLSDDPEKK